MQFMKSCFNPTIYKKNWERFWFFPLLYAILFLFAMPILMELNRSSSGSLDSSFIAGSIGFLMSPVLAMITGLVAAMGVCSYLYTTRSVYMIHSFPVTRLQLYITSVVSGITMMAAPIILAAVVTRIYLQIIGCSFGFVIWHVMLLSLCMHVVFFAIAMVCALLCGMNISVPFIYLIINFLVSMISLVFEGMTNAILFGVEFGLPNDVRRALTPIEQLLSSVEITTYNSANSPFSTPHIYGTKVVLIYTAIALAVLVLSFFIYKFRKNEAAGSVFAFKHVGIILGQWILSMILGIGFALLFYSLGGELNSGYDHNGMSAVDLITFVLMTIVFGFIAAMLSGMLLNRSLHIWKKPYTTRMILIPSVLALITVIIWLDPMGVQKKLPDASDVSYVKGFVSNNGGDVIYTEDPEHIQDMINVHKQSIDEHITALSSSYSCNYSVTYHLKNGTELKRYYLFETSEDGTKKEDSIDGLLAKIASYPECIKISNFGKECDSNIITSVCLVKDSNSVEETAYSEDIGLSKEDCRALYEAVLADIDAGNPLSVNNSDGSLETYSDYLDIYYRYPHTQSRYSDEYDSIASIYLTPESTHTIDALIKLGVINTADDLKDNN